MVQSNGRNLCEVWGGRVIKEISFCVVTMMAGIDKSGSYWLKVKQPGSSLPDISHEIKCFR